MNRIPLWIDLRQAADPAACKQAATAAGAEQIIADINGDEIQDSDGVTLATVIEIKDAKSQEKAAKAPGRVVIIGRDWTIIPLENLIAERRDRPDSLYAYADSQADLEAFRETLDLGVHGIVLAPQTPEQIAAAHEFLISRGPRPDDSTAADEQVILRPATVESVEPIGSGDRVCIDCASQFEPGEGLLIGSTARSFALVHAETEESEYVRARPFRVNAGAIHSYIFGAGRTNYLSELRAGATVAAYNSRGESRTLLIGRSKIERRPFFLVTWDGGSAMVQNAETIRFVNPDGSLVSVTDLAPGIKIMVHDEAEARHFGMAVKERLVER